MAASSSEEPGRWLPHPVRSQKMLRAHRMLKAVSPTYSYMYTHSYWNGREIGGELADGTSSCV